MNEQIQKARDAAIEALKPSAKDIEHGLELHANSLVFESYGFAPRAAPDGAALAAAIDAGASNLELQDMREEMMMTRMVTVPAERKEFTEAWDASGVDCIFQNAGEEGGNSPKRLIRRLARFTYVGDFMRDYVVRAATPDDVVAAHATGKRAFYMSANSVPLAQEWTNPAEELRYIAVSFQLGHRMMHLTYNRRNLLGDGCGEATDAGLSDFGRAAVAEMNRVGVIVDVAHSGWQTALEAAQASSKPMVASHSGCCAVNENIRCKPDNVIRAIADTGGFVGVCCIPSFLGGAGDINAMLDHIDHIVKTFGPDHTAIGTDVAYTSRNAATEMAKVAKFPRSRQRWAALWPKGSLESKPAYKQGALTMAWTNWPMFTVGMVQRGYSDDDIQKILGGNVLRVALAVLQH